MEIFWKCTVFIELWMTRKLCLPTKFPNQEIRRNFGILCSLYDSIRKDKRRTEQLTFSAIESMTYCSFNFFLRIFSNNTGFAGIGFGVSLLCFNIKAIISSFFMFMVGVSLRNLLYISHYPSLLLLSSLWVNSELTYSQISPQIWLHSYHLRRPHMTPQSKGEFFYNGFTAPSLLIFLSTVVLIKSNFLYYQTKIFEQYRANQTKFDLSLFTSGFWSSACTFKQLILDFPWWLSDNLLSIIYHLVLPYGNS